MKLTYILKEILLEYSESLIKKLIAKYQNEQPDLSSVDIRATIVKFDNIKSKLDPSKRDITKYNWDELISTIEANQSSRIKAGKIDKNNIEGDINLVYNKDGIRVYKADSKKACIKYGNGYSFCISSRGKDNPYDSYRYGEDDSGGGLPYFIFNDNKSFSKDNNGKFIDPQHLLVLFIFEDGEYTVTEADNSGDENYENFDKIVIKYPFLKNLKNVFKYSSPPPKISTFFYKVLDKAYDKWVKPNFDVPGQIYNIFRTNSDKAPFNTELCYDILDGKEKIFKIIYTKKDDPDFEAKRYSTSELSLKDYTRYETEKMSKFDYNVKIEEIPASVGDPLYNFIKAIAFLNKTNIGNAGKYNADTYLKYIENN